MSPVTASRPVTETSERPSPLSDARAAETPKRETVLVQAAYSGGAGGASVSVGGRGGGNATSRYPDVTWLDLA